MCTYFAFETRMRQQCDGRTTVDNTCGVTTVVLSLLQLWSEAKVGQEDVLICAHILHLKPECGKRTSVANFLIVFHNYCGSILLSFRDMTMERQPLPVW